LIWETQPDFNLTARLKQGGLFRFEFSPALPCKINQFGIITKNFQAVQLQLSAGVQKEKSVRVQKEKLYSE
jgi:hypothetical protein